MRLDNSQQFRQIVAIFDVDDPGFLAGRDFCVNLKGCNHVLQLFCTALSLAHKFDVVKTCRVRYGTDRQIRAPQKGSSTAFPLHQHRVNKLFSSLPQVSIFISQLQRPQAGHAVLSL